MENLTPVTLVVKAPNQKIADQTIECALDWTVKKLKEHLSSVYPSKPTENQQRIIYSGRLLQDHLQLKDILRQYEPDQQIHTVHLVCSSDAIGSPQYQQQQQMASSQPKNSPMSSEGLRHRRTAASSDDQPDQAQSQQAAGLTHQSPHSVPATTTAHATGVHPMMYGIPHAQMPPMQPMVLPGVFPGMMPYNAEQMLWMQQYYTQYMAQYMQYHHQQGYQPADPNTPVSDAVPQTPPHAAARPELAAPAPAQRPRQPEIVRMNAQGGPVIDDDDDEPNRDWLDYIYICIRFGLLLCILYFYSTIGRFVATLGLIVILYLYQAGWFRVHRRNQPVPGQQQQQRPAQQPAAAAGPDNQQDAGNNAEAAGTDDDAAAAGPVEPPAPRGLSLAWTFFVSFFASLAPQQPPPINAN